MTRFRAGALVCAWITGIVGLAGLLGWLFDIAWLQSVVPHWQAMAPRTAVGFILAGVSLGAAARCPDGEPDRGWRSVPALGMSLIGAMTLAEHYLAADLGIDQVIGRMLPLPAGDSAIGRMALLTAWAFVFAGVALSAVVRDRTHLWAQVLAVVGFLMGFWVILNYAYGVDALYQLPAFATMAFHTAVALSVINLGILCVRPERGLFEVLTSTSAGGVLARGLLPVIVIAPAMIGWLRITGERQRYYRTEVGVAVVAITYVVLFGTLLWRMAIRLQNNERRQIITDAELQATHRALQASEARYRTLSAGTFEGAMVSEQGVCVDLNDQLAQLLGYRREELLGHPFTVWLPPEAMAPVLSQVRSGMTGTLEHEIMRQDGSRRLVEAHGQTIDENGRQLRLTAIRDITERRQAEMALKTSEAEFRAFFDNAVVGAAETTLDGRYLRVNAQFCQMLGYSADELLQLHTSDLIHPDDAAEVGTALDEDLSGDRLSYHAEKRYVRKDGQVIWVEVSVALVRDAAGQPVGTAGIVRDISARKIAEASLRKAVAAAEKANEGKSRFLAAASHDLRQPLAALSIYVDAIKNHVTQPGLPMLANMKTCIAGLSELLTNLLDLSKLEAQVVQPKISDFDLADLLAKLLSAHHPEALNKGLDLRVRPSDWTVRTDPVLLQRILGNFIANAIRYTGRGGVLVAARRRQGKTWLEVWDTGIGIAAGSLSEIFEEFRQLGDGARHKGSGLGLTIAARTAELLGLEILVRSRPGRGSLFAVEVPLSQRRAPSGDARPGTSRYQTHRIALVEDNRNVRDALVLGLQALGHQVIAAASGSALIDRLAGFSPEIVISDYRLANGEIGYDVIDQTRDYLAAAIPALLITGDTAPSLVREMAQRGITVLHKPVDLETLQAYVEDACAPEDVIAP
ncbi:MAG: PAS domain S-box protein [Bacteroidota bacterium]